MLTVVLYMHQLQTKKGSARMTYYGFFGTLKLSTPKEAIFGQFGLTLGSILIGFEAFPDNESVLDLLIQHSRMPWYDF